MRWLQEPMHTLKISQLIRKRLFAVEKSSAGI